VKLSPADIRAIAVALADELERRVANANHSGQPSPVGIAAPVGDDRCDEVTNRGYMDRINTATSGEITMSSEEAMERGRRFTMSIQQGNLPRPHSQARDRKRKATP
jgi:hypothetical protein